MHVQTLMEGSIGSERTESSDSGGSAKEEHCFDLVVKELSQK